MEGFPSPEDETDESETIRVAKAAILDVLLKLSNEFRSKAGLSLKDILLEDQFASLIYDQVADELRARGIELDSLGLTELILQIVEGDDSSDPEGEGGSGVREPRRPFPSMGGGAIRLKPVDKIKPIKPEPGPLSDVDAL